VRERRVQRCSLTKRSNARFKVDNLRYRGLQWGGKNRFRQRIPPHEVRCLRFYNADEIARGLSPLEPSAGAIKAGRLLLGEVRESIDRRETFALESTLSGKTYVRIFRRALSFGYETELHYPLAFQR
jgi:predicted ABC-type ATPase